MLPPPGTESTVVIGVDYDTWHYIDVPSPKIWEAGTGCDPGHWWVMPNIGGQWNDRISSAKGYSGCVQFRHFEDENYAGALRNCTPNCYYIGDAMNDRTTSLQWDN